MMSQNKGLGIMRNNQMHVEVASDFNETIQAIAIRAAVYVGEKGWPFKEEWDGNDFTATHLLARVNGDSAGTLRIRYFGDVAKLERLAVLPKFRQKRYGRKGVAFELVDYAIDFVQKKGFNKVYGHALSELVPFWNRATRGKLIPLPDAAFDCAGKEVVPMFGEFPAVPGAIQPMTDHFATVRREGALDKPGYWEGGDPVPSMCLFDLSTGQPLQRG
jgi:GNAT superfamily N-acetyltransferase